MNIENRGFEAYAEKDKGIEEEARIGKIFQEIATLSHPRFLSIPSVEEIAKGGTRTVAWVKPFVGHPERVSWLSSFLEKYKNQMQDLLSSHRVGFDILTNYEQWVQFRKNNFEFVSTQVMPLMRNMRDELDDKTNAFDEEDAKVAV